VKELPLEVEDVVFTALASAQIVLTQHQKNLGALVIDIGGGTTDYILYVDGAVKQSGVLGVGGDHITNDISMGLRIPMARAEKLKIEEGSCTLGNCLPGETILLKDDSGFAGKEIERETLNTIIHLRLRESLELLKRQLDEESFINYIGAGIFITGGCSLLGGMDHLAEEIFDMPAHAAHARGRGGRAVERHALAQRPERGRAHRSSGEPRPVGLGHLEGRVREPVGELAVVGEQDQSRRVDVETADRVQANAARHQRHDATRRGRQRHRVPRLVHDG